MASIFILDSEPFTRDGIREYLQLSNEHHVVGEDESGLNAIPKILAERPELLITDLYVHELNGLEVIRRIHLEIPSIGIVVYTRKLDSNFVSRAVKYGARAYVLKDSGRSELSTAISEVLNGRTHFCETVSNFVDENGHSVDLYEQLTSREREVLQLVAEGKTAPEITSKLFISVRTVEKHRSNLMKKLNVHSHNDLIRYALQRGLIPFHKSNRNLAS